MKRVFIPNRGEIAVRIVATCRNLGLESVVGASEPDMNGMAADLADDAVCLGPGPAEESYLRDDLVVQAAQATGCDAIHPGYGFLSDSARLAAGARASGLTFVGPPTEAIELAGDKLAATAEAERAGAPVYPGGALERLVNPARHVEVQIAADEHGNTLALGDRDCSVRRRWQNVVDEAPAPDLPDRTRTRLRDASVAIARQIGYRNLGTVEFLIDAVTGDPYFLQLTSRIQVQHPVTEAVTGLDLVAMQLRLASGLKIGVRQDAVTCDGHAIECRLNAEDPVHDFRPSPGTISLFAVPERHGLRVDTHCQAGTAVPPFYDPLLAKLIAHGGDRDQAIKILIEALEEFDVDGVETNRMLLIGVLARPDFRAGPVTTDWLEDVVL